MLNERKIRLMTKLAVFEEKEGKEDIKLVKYYKNDFVRYQLIKTMLSVTLGYALILIMIAFYKIEFLITKMIELDYIAIGKTVLGVYVILLTVYVLISLIGYSLKFESSRKKINQYMKNLKMLRKFYREEDSSK